MNLVNKFIFALAMQTLVATSALANTVYTYTSGGKINFDYGSNFAEKLSFSFTVADGTTGNLSSLSNFLDYSFTNGSTTYSKGDSVSSNDSVSVTIASNGTVTSANLITNIANYNSTTYTSAFYLYTYLTSTISASVQNSGSLGNNPTQFYGAGTWSSAISPVPEANTYAMMIAGLSLIGIVKRRRKDI